MIRRKTSRGNENGCHFVAAPNVGWRTSAKQRCGKRKKSRPPNVFHCAFKAKNPAK
jgi:hypothetical protein